MSKLHEVEDEVLSEINMTPLVDVMLVLLIVFMIAAPVMTHVVKLDLPRAASAPAQSTARDVTISVTRDGTVLWDARPVDDAALAQALAAAASQRPQPEIRIRGDQSVAYGKIAAILAAARRAGIARLGFVTTPTP